MFVRRSFPHSSSSFSSQPLSRPFFGRQYRVLCGEVARLRPPIFNGIAIRTTVSRPFNDSGYTISHESKDGKSIIHCYNSNGGVGISTFFGAIDFATKRFQTELERAHSIRVLGGDYLGMAAGIELKRKGFKVKGITGDRVERNSFPFTLGYSFDRGFPLHLCNGEQQREIFDTSLDRFEEIATGRYLSCFPRQTVRTIPYYLPALSLQRIDLERYIRPAREVRLDFGNGVIYFEFVEFPIRMVNPTYMQRGLERAIQNFQIPVDWSGTQGTSVKRFSESVIFNCMPPSFLTEGRGHAMKYYSLGESLDYAIDTYFEGHRIRCFPFQERRMEHHGHAVIGGNYYERDQVSDDVKIYRSRQIRFDEFHYSALTDVLHRFFYGIPK